MREGYGRRWNSTPKGIMFVMEFKIRGVSYQVDGETLRKAYDHPMSILKVGPHLVRVTRWFETDPPQAAKWDVVNVPGGDWDKS